MLRLIVENLRDAVFVFKDRKILYANQAALKLTGFSDAQLKNIDYSTLLEPGKAVELETLAEQSNRDCSREVLFNLVSKSGQSIPVAMVLNDERHDELGQLYIASVRDISIRQQLNDQLQRSEQEFRQIIENMPDTFYRTDAEGVLTMASPSCVRILGYPPEEVLGRKLIDFYYEPSGRDEVLAKLAASGGKPIQHDSALRHKDGHRVWVFTHLYARTDEQGNYIGVEGITRESTKRKLDEQRWLYAANHDFLTGLNNRGYLYTELERATKRAKRRNEELTLVYFDLDDFKPINDNHSHQAGDLVLTTIAQRVKQAFRDSDLLARIGGDEFAILFENAMTREQAAEVANELVRLCQLPVEFEGHPLQVSASAGVACFPRHGEDYRSLLESADRAMYQAKRSGKNQIALLD